MRKIIFLLTLFLLITPTLALKETTIYLPAVEDTEYGHKGALASVTVDIKEGNGHVYVDTWPLTKVDTQASAIIAKKVACDILFLDCSKYDFYYTIRSEAQIVGGPSGGAAMTIATLASLLDAKINNNVMITGTINLDGSIGAVSGIIEKAEAVSEMGDTFLIPKRHFIFEENTSGQVDAVKYASDHWNLTVKKVSSVQEAFKYFTNYEIKTPEFKFERSKEYQQVMKKLADKLLENAKELKSECEIKLKNSKIGYDSEKQVSELCELSLDKAEENYNKENYYSAASLAFSKSISYKYGIKLTELLESEDKKNLLKNYLNNIESQIFEINTPNIELYAITEERLSETNNNLELAWRDYYNEDYTQSMYYASFADQRLYTAISWMSYADQFPKYIEISRDPKKAANEILSETSSILTYISLTTSNSLLSNAYTMLEKARDNYNSEKYYASIITGIKSYVNAELASEVLYKEDEYLIELHRRRALAAINKTNSVIGQSYFEYAETLKEDDSSASLVYYTYAEKLSNLNHLLNQDFEPEEIKPSEFLTPVSCNYDTAILFLTISVILCFIAGVITGKTWK